MDLFQITDNKIQATTQLNPQLLLSNPEQYVFLLSYLELVIMRQYLGQFARGRSYDDACNKCGVEWHKPLIALSTTIIAHPAYLCTSYMLHESAYMYMQVAPEGTGDKAVMAAKKLIDGIAAQTPASPVKKETPPLADGTAAKPHLIARIWLWIKEAHVLLNEETLTYEDTVRKFFRGDRNG